MRNRKIRTITDLRSVRYSAMLAGVAALALFAAACPAGDDPPASEPEPEPMPGETAAPTITASLSAERVDEGGSVMLTLTADADLESAVMFSISAAEGITFEGASGASAMLGIAAGERTASIEVNAPELEDTAAETLEAVITVTAPSDAEVELEDTMLSLTIVNMLPAAMPMPDPEPEPEPMAPSGPAMVMSSLSSETVGEGERVTLTLTTSWALSEDADFMLSADPPNPGASFDGGRRVLRILAGESSGSIEVIGGEITDSALRDATVSIRFDVDSPAVDFVSGFEVLSIENDLDLTLEEPRLSGSMVTLRVNAGYGVPEAVIVPVNFPEGVFSEESVELRIPANTTTGRATLRVVNAPASGREVVFSVDEFGVEGVDNYKVPTARQTLTFP